MPKLSKPLPKYRRHEASGNAVATLAGIDHYCGRHGTAASREKYDRLVVEWLRRGRVRGSQASKTIAPRPLSVVEVMAAYLRHTVAYYQKDGNPTSEYIGLKYAFRPLKQLHGRTPTCNFGPLSLQVIRDTMIALGLSRGVITKNVDRIRRSFSWASSQEDAPISMEQNFTTLASDSSTTLPASRDGRTRWISKPPSTGCFDGVVTVWNLDDGANVKQLIAIPPAATPAE